VGHLDHNRSYGFNASANPSEKWSLDLHYDYNDVFSTTNICFVSTPSPPVAISCGGSFTSGLSVYTEHVHSGGGGLFFHPVRGVTAGIGYTITSTVGDTLILNPNAPFGPLSYNYHLPSATLAIDLSKHFTYNTGWNFYDYNEKSDPGPTLPRNMRGNVFTLSMRYKM
jgi:opacity protein-like surface antigen